jgi:hypothetical protein
MATTTMRCWRGSVETSLSAAKVIGPMVMFVDQDGSVIHDDETARGMTGLNRDLDAIILDMAMDTFQGSTDELSDERETSFDISDDDILDAECSALFDRFTVTVKWSPLTEVPRNSVESVREMISAIRENENGNETIRPTDTVGDLVETMVASIDVGPFDAIVETSIREMFALLAEYRLGGLAGETE